ncbi:SDR family oxidoreductase [Allorhizocola rhizosphaerae]|uniref:SDR family oxidoreductase n=1 Tax=Allorhizocola rhizosphaerae TaxID=1872709 RepID=UPI000E3E8980|nr:sugar nucleotide-binding protein [Allorhizocola rhizosphaerae]
MRVLVTGGSGTLGGAVVRQAIADGHEVVATYASRVGDADVSWVRMDIREAVDFSTVRPDVVVHTAYKQSDWRTTADGAANVAVAARKAGARLVHVSSDAVFSGNAGEPYDEWAVPDPCWPYGAAKAAAETAVRAIDPTAAIVRTSLIIPPRVTLPPVLFTDDIRCPVDVSDLACALLELADSTEKGVFHVAGAEALSRYELGMLVAKRDGLDPARFSKGPRNVPGPLDVRLDCSYTQSLLKTRLRGASEFLGW